MFAQSRLRREDWEAMEVPYPRAEREIVAMIAAYGRGDGAPTLRASSLASYMKLDASTVTSAMHVHLYRHYFGVVLRRRAARYKLPAAPDPPTQKAKLKKADVIRIENTASSLSSDRGRVYECVLADQLKAACGSGVAAIKGAYTAAHLLTLDVPQANPLVVEHVRSALVHLNVRPLDVLQAAEDCIEKNAVIATHQPLQAYPHQRELLAALDAAGPKLVLYQAPTGTGKTLSPVAVAQTRPVVFVCAAKHVGVQLAKSCVSAGVPFGVAFGCESTSDVKLHYSAAKDYTKNWKSGGIFRVDHSNGAKAQLIISDVVSFLPAMRYIKAFKPIDDTVLYWDEPTIALDYDDHPCHAIIRENWAENEIRNIVFSSATLPSEREIPQALASMRARFPGLRVATISSSECARTIPVVSPTGLPLMPHTLYESHARACASAEHCRDTPTTMRHLGLGPLCKFVIEAQPYLDDDDRLEARFPTLQSLSAVELKLYYLDVLEAVGSNWAAVRAASAASEPIDGMKSTVKLTTDDAHTVTGGPAIYLCADPSKVARYCVQSAAIPEGVLAAVLSRLDHNEKTRTAIEKLSKAVEGDSGKSAPEKDRARERRETEDATTKQRLQEIERLESSVVETSLDSRYVPNTPDHVHRYAKGKGAHAFACDIPERYVRQIAQLRVDPMWKVLMLMGIGAFVEDLDRDYLNVMRALAYEQRLFCVVASSDYIYGTNYQFCHGYIGKDLSDITAEKVIQAIGRIGRGAGGAGYSVRLRDAEIAHKIFLPCASKPEVRNMNALFRCG
jgi:hypothetical protein